MVTLTMLITKNRNSDMSNSQYFLPSVMDMGSRLGTIIRAILNYKRVPMSTFNGSLVKQILTVIHIIVVTIISATCFRGPSTEVAEPELHASATI